MRTLSRWLGRGDVVRVAAATFGATVLILVASYVVGVAYSGATPATAAALAALLAIAGSGILYAWRLGAGGLD